MNFLRDICKQALSGAVVVLVTTIAFTPAWADMQARVASRTVGVGQSFVLQLQVDSKSATTAPDLSPLQNEFDVLATSRSSQTSIINGSRTDTIGWLITLAPKIKGKITIPALTAGTETSQPIRLNVVDASKLPASSTANTGIEVQVTADTKTRYVQEEIPVTVRIITGGNLRNASLETPTSSRFLLTQRGKDTNRQMVRNGRQVTVIERNYLLKPQVSGKIVVPPMTLKAVLSVPSNSRSPFEGMYGGQAFGNSLFGNSFFDNFVNSGKEVVVRSNPLVLEIKARPGKGNGWFLPAKNVKLSEQWSPEKPVFRVGETVSRIIRVVALGASNEQLPDLNVSSARGAKVYLDKTRNKSIDTPDGTAAIREFTMSVVPTKAGEISFPAIEVKWWDTTLDKQRVAILPAQTFTTQGFVAPSSTGLKTPVNNVREQPLVDDQMVNSEQLFWSSPLVWWGAGIFTVIIAALGFVVMRGKKRHLHTPASSKNIQKPDQNAETAQRLKSAALFEKQFRTACAQKKPQQAYAALCNWIDVVEFQKTKKSTENQALMREMQALEKCLYAPDASAQWQPENLVSAFNAAKRNHFAVQLKSRKKPVLPSLYEKKSINRFTTLTLGKFRSVGSIVSANKQ